MKKIKLMNNVSRHFHKAGLTVRKHSPEILAVAGVVGVVASAVMACKATTKVSAILERTKEDVDAIHEVAAKAPEVYSQQDSKKDLTIVYTRTGVQLAKLYAPSVVLGAMSITSILASNNILRKRNVALAAAYSAVDSSFKNYRSRVIERFGKELDKELRYNIKAQEVEEVVVNEKGKEKTVTRTVNVVDPNMYSDYARIFDCGCAGWEKDSEYNLLFLRTQQNYANDLLRTKGYLFLNDVYDMLGIPRSKAGQIVGWVYDENNPDVDNFVDFGIYDPNNERACAFVNGYERSIVLDFNVDGNIWDLMK